MKCAAFLLLVACAAARPADLSQSPGFAAFYGGLVSGLQLNATVGPCATALTAAKADIGAVVSDFWQMVQGDEKAITYFLLDARDALGDLHVSNPYCKLSTLWDALTALGTTAGQQTLTLSFTMNISVFLLDFQQLALCGSNWASCGFAVGELLRMTASWGIF